MLLPILCDIVARLVISRDLEYAGLVERRKWILYLFRKVLVPKFKV